MTAKSGIQLGSARKGHGSKFGRKKEEAIAALMTERNVEEAARAAKIGTQTLYRWMKDPEFQKEYLDARRAAVAQSNARLQQATGAAVSMLLKTMVDASTPPATKVRAANSVLDHSRSAIEIDDIVVRVGALEQAAKPPGVKEAEV
jgi:hypothetical protein